MTKAEAKRDRLVRRALEHLARRPIHETVETPLSVTQELIGKGLARYDYTHQWTDGRWHYRDVVITDAGRQSLSEAASV